MSEHEAPYTVEDDKKKKKNLNRAKRRPEGRPRTPVVRHRASLQTLTTFSTPLLDKNGLVKVALRESMTGGSFINTKFYAFSRRRTTGIVDSPLPIYASSELLKAESQYFRGNTFTIHKTYY